MQLLNLACNGHRPGPPFLNIDVLRSQLKPGTAERVNLDAESNYLDHDLKQGIPFASETVDGLLCSHFLEHLDAAESIPFLRECYRVLKPGHVLLVSVPDAHYFLCNYARDTKENAVEIFGEGIYDWVVDGKSVGPFDRFFDYALFHHEHKQILTEDAVACLLLKAGFPAPVRRYSVVGLETASLVLDRDSAMPAFRTMVGELNRPKFSLVMWARK